MKKQLCVVLCLLCSVVLFGNEALRLDHPALNPVTMRRTGTTDSFTLFADGQSDCVLVVPYFKAKKPFPWITHVQTFTRSLPKYGMGVEGYAALELQKAIQATAGVKLPIQTSNQPLPAGKKPIFIGMSKVALDAGFNNQDVPPEGFKVQVRSDAMAILGAPQPKVMAAPADGVYGVIFGVYDVAERILGMRFYYPGPDGTVCHPRKTLNVPAMVYADGPWMTRRLMFHWMTSTLPGYDQVDPMEMALRYRAGGHGPLGAVAQPEHWRNPVRKGMKAAVDKEGNILQTRPLMPCLSAPETVKGFLETVAPRSQIARILIPDHPVICQCPRCSARYDMKAPFHGQASPVFGDFIARTAQEMKKTMPGKTLFFTAYYNYTSPAQGLVLPDNTKAMLCLMYGQSIYHDPAVRKYTREWIRDWKRITGKPVSIYVYPNWPSISYSPFPRQYYHLLKNFFQENRDGMDGFFSDGPCNGGVDAVRGSFYATVMPTTYCEFRLLWNPDYDVDAGVLDMCRQLYGTAWKPMHEIITGIAGLWESKATVGHPGSMSLGHYFAGGISKEILYGKIIRPEFVRQLQQKLAQAERSVAATSVERRRIDVFGDTLRLFFQDYKIFHNPEQAQKKQALVPWVPLHQKFEDKVRLPIWEKLPAQPFVNAHLSHGPKPPHTTTVKMAYDKWGMLFRFTMQEPQMDMLDLKGRDAIYAGDCLEMFVEYTPGSVYQLLVNARGDFKDLFHGKRPAHRRNMAWRNIEKGKDSWMLTVYLPFATLNADDPFKADRVVRFNAARTRKLRNGYRHVSRWNTTFQRRHISKDAFGELHFAEPPKDNPEADRIHEVSLRRLPTTGKLDNRLKQVKWDELPKHDFAQPKIYKGITQPEQTTAQLAYDQDGLFFRFDMAEPEMKQVQAEPRETIRNGDCIEVCVEYHPGTVYHVVFNKDNTLQDHFVGQRPARRKSMPWRTIQKQENGWSLNLYLPFATLNADLSFDPAKTVTIKAIRRRALKTGYRNRSTWQGNVSFK